jgi:nitric oxide reductase FlRd-NAD(+) reductase
MPAEVSSRLQHRLTDMGVHLQLKSQLQSLTRSDTGICALMDRDRCIEVDVVIAATGLRPEIGLAQRAGAETQRGVKVDSYLQTTQPDIYALGDCAEINGQVLPFLQPIQLSAMYLAKNLLGANTPLKLPAMLVKVKTPELPLHLAGETQRQDLNWQIAIEPQGMVAKGADSEGNLRAFVVSEDRMKEAFALLKSLPV